jgi:hypothetical protein
MAGPPLPRMVWTKMISGPQNLVMPVRSERGISQERIGQDYIIPIEKTREKNQHA